MNIPTVIFINKIDQVGVDLQGVYQSVRDKLSADKMCIRDRTGRPRRMGWLDLVATRYTGVSKVNPVLVSAINLLSNAPFPLQKPSVFKACLLYTSRCV